MKKLLKKMQESWMLSAVISIILGLIFLIIPGFITKAAGYLMGIAAILLGAGRVIRYFRQENIYPEFFRGDLLIGFLAAGIGLFIMLHVESVISIVPVLCGAVLLSNGVVGLQRTLGAYRANYSRWWLLMIFALLTLGAGILLIINPFAALKTAVSVIGAALIYEGGTDIITMLMAGKQIDGWKNTVKK